MAVVPDRRLAGEYETCGNTLLGAYHEGPITLSIDERTMRDNAGCTAEYSAEGPNLTVRLGDAPACAAKALPFVPGEPVPVGGAISVLAVTRPASVSTTKAGCTSGLTAGCCRCAARLAAAIWRMKSLTPPSSSQNDDFHWFARA